MVEKTGIEKQSFCYHCGQKADFSAVLFDEKTFCCAGCKTVYNLLNENGLCDYYSLNSTPGQNQKITARPEKFSFLEDRKIADQLISFRDRDMVQINFYLPHIHCSSCLWLLEHLHQLNAGIHSSRVDFVPKEVSISFNEKIISLKQVAELLTEIGYEPYISLNELDKKPKKFYNRQRLYKLGVAGFCLGNIMLLAFPEYLSIAESKEQIQLTPWFRYLNLALSLPVFFYCASEFFIQGWSGIRKGYLNIDAPIALAILITFLRSTYEVISATGGGYFDSLAGIVFFMLLGRILQDKTQQKLTFDRDYTSYFPIAVNKKENDKETPTTLPELRIGDTIVIFNGEIIPADGMLIKGQASIDYSFVTGESVPVTKNISELIYAGGRQMAGKIELLLVKDVSQSYLTGLWNKASQKNDYKEDQSFIHPLAKYFTIILFILTGLVSIYWWINDSGKILPVITSMLIVACPCALLLSSTFTNGHVMRALDNAGMYVKNYGVLERLLKISHIVFDKTGTLTNSNQFQITYSGDTLNAKDKIKIASLASQSQHPLSKALFEHLHVPTEKIENFKETPGQGIVAWQDEQLIKIGNPLFVWGHQPAKVNGSLIAVTLHQKKGLFILKNAYRKGLQQQIKELQHDYNLSLISGDNEAEWQALTQMMGDDVELKFNQSPHDKLDYITQLQQNKEQVLMVGDGLNDAAALLQSEVGMAVTDNVNNFSPACDVILEAKRISNLSAYLRLIKGGKKVILFSFAVSILYNITGLSFAALGLLTPLVAAILMPASSISILLITWIGIYFYSRKLV